MTRTKEIRGFFTKNMVVILLLLMMLFMTIVNRNFLTLSNLTNIFIEMSTYGTITMAMTIAIICGEFDLSAGATYALCSVFFLKNLDTMGIFPAILVTVLIGAAVGFVNGFLVAKLDIPAFVATLGSMTYVRGIALLYTDGQPVSNANQAIYQWGNGSFLGIPNLVLTFLIFVVITECFLKFTKSGREIYAVGGNRKIAELAGINAQKSKLLIFVILGIAAGIAGVMISCRMASGSAALLGLNTSMSAISAVVVGGTSLSGGSGSAVRSLIGLLVISVLFNALTLLGIGAYYQQLIRGLVVIIIVAIDVYMSLNKKD